MWSVYFVHSCLIRLSGWLDLCCARIFAKSLCSSTHHSLRQLMKVPFISTPDHQVPCLITINPVSERVKECLWFRWNCSNVWLRSSLASGAEEEQLNVPRVACKWLASEKVGHSVIFFVCPCFCQSVGRKYSRPSASSPSRSKGRPEDTWLVHKRRVRWGTKQDKLPRVRVYQCVFVWGGKGIQSEMNECTC